MLEPIASLFQMQDLHTHYIVSIMINTNCNGLVQLVNKEIKTPLSHKKSLMFECDRMPRKLPFWLMCAPMAHA